MSARAVRKNEVCGATCGIHGAITITFNSGSTTVKFSGDGIVRVGDTGVPSCGASATASVGSTIVKANALGVHRVGDTGSIVHNSGPGSTYTITSGTTNYFVD